MGFPLQEVKRPKEFGRHNFLLVLLMKAKYEKKVVSPF
jgi:hypothetical protein